MATESSAEGVLTRWLAEGGQAALDFATGEALDIVAIVDRDLVIRYVNWTAPTVTREQVLGHNVVDLSPSGYRERARSRYQSVLDTGIGSRFEYTYDGGDHLLLWEVRIGPIRHDGEIIGLMTISTDVTERRHAEADRDRFFELSLDTLMVAQPTGHIKRVNPAFGVTLGYEDADFVGKPFIDFIHPDDRAATEADFATLVGGKPLIDFENRYRKKDGQYLVFSWRAIVDPVTGEAYGVARDVTEQRATELQLRHAQKMEAIGQLAGGVAHDFNNLMQAVMANTELAMTLAAPSPELSEYLTAIEAAAERAGALTRQLLAFGRRQALNRVPVDVNELIQGLIKMLRRLLPENISVNLIRCDGLASVSADPTQLEQVLINLCVNARDAMPRGGKLTLETENVSLDASRCGADTKTRPGRYVLVRVTDTGTGILPELRERIFEPFFTTKGPHQGTGLGLATAYGIVEQHEGTIRVDSEPGHGTCFQIYLPADTQLTQEVTTGPGPAPSPLGHETILVAEDEAPVRKAVVEILRRGGYHLLEAADGLEAVNLLRRHPGPVDLILLDVVMPELDGPELWEQLKRLRADLRVLFTSGYTAGQDRERLPSDARIVEKPFRAQALLEQVRAVLDA